MATYQPVAKASFSSVAFPGALPLLATGDDVVSQPCTVAAGINSNLLKRGQIVKWAPDTKAVTMPAAATDANAIVVDDIDCTAAATGLVYTAGIFSAAAVLWPGVLNHGLVTDALRDYGIFLQSVVFTDGTLVRSATTEAEAAEAQKKLDKARADQKAEAEEAAKAAAGKSDDPDKPKPSDSAWAYMTAEEREKNPALLEAADTPPPKPTETGATATTQQHSGPATLPTHKPTHK